jgi:hypothetical protein
MLVVNLSASNVGRHNKPCAIFLLISCKILGFFVKYLTKVTKRERIKVNSSSSSSSNNNNEKKKKSYK